MSKKTITIPNRFSDTPCWVGEIEDMRSNAKNLGRAVLEALKSGADLSGADLSGANLSGADLSGVKNAELAVARTRILPEGSLIGYKWCRGSRIVRLRIPEDARRSHAFGRKCRAERAEVLEITGPDGTQYQDAVSSWGSDFVYRVGETVVPANGFSESWQEECAGGIHFYLTRIEAENH